MRQRRMPAVWRIGAVAGLALALLVLVRPGIALAKDHPEITVSPSKGSVGTQVTITGKSFPAFCAGVIFIDSTPTDAVYGCDSNGNFQSRLTWPDGLDDGKHTINARGTFSSAQATFTQNAVTPTPDSAATVAAGATATAGAGQATAAAQSTATAAAPTAISGAASGGNATPPSNGGSISPAVLTMILVASLLLIAGGVLLALALSNRRHAPHSMPAQVYRPVPPPPPSDATLPQGDEWVWPNDPYRR